MRPLVPSAKRSPEGPREEPPDQPPDRPPVGAPQGNYKSLPGDPVKEPPPRSEEFPFFSDAAVKQLLQRCSSRRDEPQVVWQPARWRLSPPRGEGSAPEYSSSSDECSSSRSKSLRCIASVALGGKIGRGALCWVSAAASVGPSPQPLVAKVCLLHCGSVLLLYTPLLQRLTSCWL